jgi:hypothetical protein
VKIITSQCSGQLEFNVAYINIEEGLPNLHVEPLRSALVLPVQNVLLGLLEVFMINLEKKDYFYLPKYKLMY